MPRPGSTRSRASAGRSAPAEPGTAPLDPRHPAALAAALIAALCVCVSVSFQLYDADGWQHLAVGRAIWQQHVWPVTNLWTWPTYGAPNVNPSWGFSALLWPFWAAGGLPGLFVWRWLTTLAVFALLWLTARRLGARGLAPLVVLVVASLIYRQRSQIRPETIASVWFALTLWVLEARRSGGADRSAWLIPIALAWANTHVSYYLGFALIGIHLLAAPSPARRRLALIALGCLAISFVNPFGWRALARPFEFVLFWRKDPLLSQISELQPFSWGVHRANGFPLMLVGWPLLLAWRASRRGLDRVELFMCGVFTVLAFTGSRFVATYAIAAAPYVARDLDALVATVRAPASLRPAWPRAAVVGVLCVLVGLVEWMKFETPIGLRFDERRTPVHACNFIEKRRIRGRALNHFFLGGYQLWRFHGERDRLPFMDIHPEDTPVALRTEYLRALNSPEAFHALDARLHFDWALLSRRFSDRPGILDILDEDPEWALVFVDDVAAVYVRRSGVLADVAERFGYQMVRGSRMRETELLGVSEHDLDLRDTYLAELRRQAQESPVDFYGRHQMRLLGVAP